MVTRPIVNNTNSIPQVTVVIKESETKPKTRWERLELFLRRAFGEDEEIIWCSLLGL